ncbi:hypothetical protein DRF67_16265 [Chryseobacterium pennipullorum]|uniref:Uncharacterized protein n=1 Tax=Chryseobacterium pennipullorum TaxID=2258963 RepID=A0A3D9AX88_9FLAO|nr:hypothetical protein DRF67_16265 [Chryseobacterium pennipullorum]
MRVLLVYKLITADCHQICFGFTIQISDRICPEVNKVEPDTKSKEKFKFYMIFILPILKKNLSQKARGFISLNNRSGNLKSVWTLKK